ncbi:MAG TPA: adenylate/guanylate cyclase domain-containing protein [Gemmatimonadales bacterium]
MSFLSRLTQRLGEAKPASSPAGGQPSPLIRFKPSPDSGTPVKHLVLEAGLGGSPRRFPLSTQLEIGRDEEERAPMPGLLLVREPSISFRHCIITQTPEGHCFVRDVSRNGTRLDGRRLVPNIETELKVGQRLDLGAGIHFVLHGGDTGEVALLSTRGRTETASKLSLATVLVGDIRDYTVLVRKAPPAQLQQSVSRLFDRLTTAVVGFGGTVKEFPGDAILAFWEGTFRGKMALSACRAAIELDRLVHQIAADPAVWALPGFPLRMDWALATGEVSIDAFGGDTTIGLSMVGEPVVLACRLEKFATDQAGSILACPSTRDMAIRAMKEQPAAGDVLEFVDLGTMQAKGFDQPDHVFALQVRHA